MKKNRISLLAAATLLAAAACFAQEESKEQQPLSSALEQQELAPKWLWGEVIAIDAPGKKLQVRYADFETDTDQETTLQVAPKTVIEGAAGFDDIKVGDTLSVDYSLSPEGFNLAEMISVERIEDEEGQLKADVPLDEALTAQEDAEAADTAKKDLPANGE